jgi:hypothetical protein
MANPHGNAGDPGQGVEVLLVRVGQRVQVLLRGLDLRMAHPVHHPFEAGTTGEQPGNGLPALRNFDVRMTRPFEAA